MRSITALAHSVFARVAARAAWYAAILIAAWVVAQVTGGATKEFIYQGF
jgi:hypothetical protein